MNVTSRPWARRVRQFKGKGFTSGWSSFKIASFIRHDKATVGLIARVWKRAAKGQHRGVIRGRTRRARTRSISRSGRDRRRARRASLTDPTDGACTLANWNAMAIDQKTETKAGTREYQLVRYMIDDARLLLDEAWSDSRSAARTADESTGGKSAETRARHHRFVSSPKNIRQTRLAEKRVCRRDCQTSVRRIERDILPSNRW